VNLSIWVVLAVIAVLLVLRGRGVC
jgi:hypothetical protein